MTNVEAFSLRCNSTADIGLRDISEGRATSVYVDHNVKLNSKVRNITEFNADTFVISTTRSCRVITSVGDSFCTFVRKTAKLSLVMVDIHTDHRGVKIEISPGGPSETNNHCVGTWR
jgi:hypothetical protein